MTEALRAQLFAGAMEKARPPMLENLQTAMSGWALPAATALAVATVLLLLRPPFSLRTEHDARRPWRAASLASWPAICTCAALAAGAVMLAQARTEA